MKITKTIYAFRHPFRLALGENHYADRFVYSYLLVGEKVCLIDTGVSGTVPLLLDYLKQLGRSPMDISTVLLTHAHPDHIGGCTAIRKASAASFHAHASEKPWIEDVERQCRERPILNFFDLVGGPVPVSGNLKEGDTLSWDAGRTIRVFETPGHSPGSVSLLLEEEGALFTGDVIPAAGTLPIYVDPQNSIRSIRRLSVVQGIRHALSAWHEPLSGDRIQNSMEEGIRYIQEIDEIVTALIKSLPPDSPEDELSLRALERLGIKTDKVFGIVRTSIESHRKK